MNPRIPLLLAVAVAVTAVVWFLLPMQGPSRSGSDAPSGGHPAKDTAGAAMPGGIAVPAPASPAATKPKLDIGRLEWLADSSKAAKPSTEDIARFLAKHGETPANLIAGFERTRDRRWLDRALELFPGNPLVLMMAIEAAPNPAAKVGEKFGPDAGRLAQIERFKAADPNNPVPWLFSAQELLKSGPTPEAIAEIRAALERPAFYVYASERTDAAQRLYKSLGVGGIEAGALATFGLSLPHIQAGNQSARMLMEWHKSAVESGDASASGEALRLTYELGRTFATPEASRLLIGQVVGISMEKRALSALPAGTKPEYLAVEPAQRLAELEQQIKEVREVASGIESVIRAEDGALFAEYVRRIRESGESAAYKWLESQRKK